MDCGVKTIKPADLSYVRLYGLRQRSVNASLGCGLGWTPAVCGVQCHRGDICGLGRYISGALR